MGETESGEEAIDGDRKRKRSTDDDEEWETPMEEGTSKETEQPTEVEPPMVEGPKKKRSRKNLQSTTVAPQQQKQQQEEEEEQLWGPVSFNMDDVRQSRREEALRILNEVLPAMVVRLRDLIRRSKAAADERVGLGADQQTPSLTGGPATMAKKKKTFLSRLMKLVKAATELLLKHNEMLKEENETVFESKKTSNLQLLQKLTVEAERLAKTHREIQHTNEQNEEDDQRRYLEGARLILSHPLFESLNQPEEDEVRQWGDASSIDPLKPLIDTTELIELVTAEMQLMIECSHDLKQWVSLYSSPLDVDSLYETQVRTTVRGIVDHLVRISEANLNYLDDYLIQKANFQDLAIKKPLSIDRLRALDSFESTRAIVWRRHANVLAMQCQHLMDFILKNIQPLEQRTQTQSALDSLYG